MDAKMTMTRFTWRSQNDPTADDIEGTKALARNDEPSLTQQQFKEDADLNTIVRRYGIDAGPIPPPAIDPRYYGDFSNAPDYRTALDTVRTAQQRFDELPAELRQRFYNDPIRLWEFVNNPANAEEAVKLKLLHQSVTTRSADAQQATVTP